MSVLRALAALSGASPARGALAALGAGASAPQRRGALGALNRELLRRAIRAGDELGYNRNFTRGLIKFGHAGMTPEARMARAREMGFDTERPCITAVATET